MHGVPTHRQHHDRSDLGVHMKTRIEIKRIYDRKEKSFIRNPILIKTPGKEPYYTAGAILHGPSEIFYEPRAQPPNPRAYIEVDGPVSRIDSPNNNPKEDKRLTYINILLETIDGNRGNKVPERRNCPCPRLLKRKAGITYCGHHISIAGAAKIVSSFGKPIRKNVYAWIETDVNVECTT
jgi:hypothetical protein